MQALEFELIVLRFGHDGRNGVCIVAGKLWPDQAFDVVAEQKARAGQIGYVGGLLAGVDRVTVKTFLLAQLDFRVPVGALDQAKRYQVALLFRQCG